MALPSGWSATNPDENVTYTSTVGGAPAEHHVSVSCTPVEHENGTYPKVTNVTFTTIGRNCDGERYSDNDPPNRVGGKAFLESTDEEYEGEENIVRMKWSGRDSENKIREWTVTVTLDLCW